MMEVTFQEEEEEERIAAVVVDSFVVEEVDIHILTIMEIETEVVLVDVIVIWIMDEVGVEEDEREELWIAICTIVVVAILEAESTIFTVVVAEEKEIETQVMLQAPLERMDEEEAVEQEEEEVIIPLHREDFMIEVEEDIPEGVEEGEIRLTEAAEDLVEDLLHHVYSIVIAALMEVI